MGQEDERVPTKKEAEKMIRSVLESVSLDLKSHLNIQKCMQVLCAADKSSEVVAL